MGRVNAFCRSCGADAWPTSFNVYFATNAVFAPDPDPFGRGYRQVHFFSQKGVLQLKLVLGIQRRVKFSNEN